MQTEHKKHNLSLIVALLIGVLSITGLGIHERSFVQDSEAAGFLRAPVSPLRRHPDTMLYRTAERLSRRIRQHSFATPSLEALASALQKKQELMKHSVTVRLSAVDGTAFPEWTANLHRYPTWLKADFSMNRAEFRVDREGIEEFLIQNPPAEITPPTDTTLIAIVEPEEGAKDPLRVETEGVAKAGYAFDAKGVAELLAAALSEGSTSVLSLPLKPVPGRIVNATERDVGALELLATGRSNFEGSITGRVRNIQKGLKERVHNVLVAPGETFSFNGTLGPVTARAGWFEALGIFNGDQLRPVTGGGICQVATTVFRAMVHAGLPIEKRKEHSLFVHYYEKYGVGLDATIYPGQQDLTFTNDTGNDLLIQAYYDGFEATVNFYGTPDGRAVALEGPYFSVNAPEDMKVKGRTLKTNEIAWRQTITAPDGTVMKNTIVSRYKTLPRSVVTKHVEEQKIAEAKQSEAEPVHAAAADLLSDARTSQD